MSNRKKNHYALRIPRPVSFSAALLFRLDDAKRLDWRLPGLAGLAIITVALNLEFFSPCITRSRTRKQAPVVLGFRSWGIIVLQVAMSIPPSSPRLPSPPPPTEIQIGPQSPMGGPPTTDSPAERSIMEANSSRRIHPGTKAADMAAGPPLIPLSEVNMQPLTALTAS